MKGNHTAVFTLKVDNEFGVLTRITALIRRAGWNIRSLAVAETKTPETSRLTICLECKNNTLDFVLEKLGKLNCVREISIFSRENQVAQEMALLRMKPEGVSYLDQFKDTVWIKTLFEGKGEILLAISCQPEQMDELLLGLRDRGLSEVARTGTIALKLPQEEDE